MALETLKGVKKIDGFKVVERNRYDEVVKEQVGDNYIDIRHYINTISFKIQNGAVKENGVNGCQVDSIIETAKIIIEKLNEKFPCEENSMVIIKLNEALMWSEKRKQNRIKRGVEGFNKI